MSKKKPQHEPENEPPSLFDTLDVFDAAPETEAVDDRADAPVMGVPHGDGLTGTGPLRDLMDENFLQFASYSICSRAIPAVEDGLKPVQRRILHALYEKDDGRFTKVANIVGHTMQYHPHGDASIGDALVNLANKRYLIQGQGNYGNIFTGAPAAAPRYIECRLMELARHEIFNKKTTTYVPSYDGRNQEPVLLPSKIPLLLMLGADGIAVGLSTAVLPHNFIELLEAEIAIIQKKPFAVYPDFQLGGLMDASEYQDGFGKVKMRAVILPRDKNKLVITELPWGETTDSLLANIEDAIKKKKVAVRQIHDFTAEKVEIELVLATGATQDKVTAALYAFTNCEKNIASRPVVLKVGRPCEMSVSDILRTNVAQLMELTKREQEIRLQELDALFHAKTLDQIFIEEGIYKRIEKEKTYEGVQQTVLDGFKPFLTRLRHAVSLDDVERLLAIKIRRISAYDINKNRDEIKAILAEEKDVQANLAGLRGYVVKYIKALIKQYAKMYPRRTKIAAKPFVQVDTRAITASELTIKIDRENGYIGTDIRGGEELFKCSSLDKILVAWKDGRWKMVPPPDKMFVDKTLLFCKIFNREQAFTAVYTEPSYGFTYIKRFVFGGAIQNKDYRLAPEKSKVILFTEGVPDAVYVKYKPMKNQRIHQQVFDPKEVTVRGVSSKGIQMTTKDIARLSTSKPSWWDDSDKEPAKGILT